MTQSPGSTVADKVTAVAAPVWKKMAVPRGGQR
ncbi:hypothetical protein UG55_103838 [Frankia sp. EI5c]|nr:hypothetical protein UG55_103838 [Frankia sp. EI5c]